MDNTGPIIEKFTLVKGADTVTLKLTASDKLSVIGKVEYTIDSNKDWQGTVPDDLVYDTKQENFTIVAEDLKPGEHVIAIKATDAVNNTTYKTFDCEL